MRRRASGDRRTARAGDAPVKAPQPLHEGGRLLGTALSRCFELLRSHERRLVIGVRHPVPIHDRHATEKESESANIDQKDFHGLPLPGPRRGNLQLWSIGKKRNTSPLQIARPGSKLFRPSTRTVARRPSGARRGGRESPERPRILLRPQRRLFSPSPSARPPLRRHRAGWFERG